MSQIPEVDYRFSDKYYITSFVTPHNPDIERVAKGFGGGNDNGFVAQVASFIRDAFAYPLIGGQPSSDAQFLRYHKSLFSYHWKRCVFYMWSFPSECLLQKLGICVDTSHLTTSLLRSGQLDAFTCLGEVRKTSTDELLGYHSWVICQYKHDTFLIETTIHEAEVNNMVTLHDACHKDSDFAKKGDIYYIEHARYDEKDYIGTTDLGRSGLVLTLMGKPLKLLREYGLAHTLEIKPKTLYKEWRREEITKDETILMAFRS